MNIRVLIVDDFEEIREYFYRILNNETNIEVVGTASSGAEAVEKALELKPDVILMDIQMERDDSGITAGKIIIEKLPETKIIAITSHINSDNISRAYSIGFVDFVTKTSSIVEIINAIQNAVYQSSLTHDTYKFILQEMVNLKRQQKKLIHCFHLTSSLSKNELSLLSNLCQGMKYKDIASERHIEEVTVRSMVNRISNKLPGMSIKEIIKTLNDCNFFEMLENVTQDD